MKLFKIVSTCVLVCCFLLLGREAGAQDDSGSAKGADAAEVTAQSTGLPPAPPAEDLAPEILDTSDETVVQQKQAETTEVPVTVPMVVPTPEPIAVDRLVPVVPAEESLDLVDELQRELGEKQVSWAGIAGRPVTAPCSGPGCFEEILQAHRSAIIAEFLYLHPRNVDVPYATPTDGIGPSSVPTGPSSVVGPGYQPGFRIGLNWNRTDSSSIAVDYRSYQSQSSDSRTLPGGSGFLNADLVHPNTTSVATDSLAARANYDLDFDLLDVHYRATISEKDYLVYLTVGARYARVDEDFHANYTMLGSTSVLTDVGFDGVGPRLGLEIERPMDSAFHLYMRGGASLLFGEFDASYQQTNVFSGTQAVVGLEDSRMVPVTELELGLGWGGEADTLRFSAGYYMAAWFNTVTTGGFIDSVQDAELYSIGGVGDTMVFDGLVARVELRY